MTAITTDPDLSARLASDLDAAFPEMVRRVSPGLYSGAYRMLGNRHDAEDITQDALVRAYRALGTYPAARIASMRLEAWAWTIAANLCRNRLRQRSRKSTVSLHDTEPVAVGASPDEHLDEGSLPDELATALLGLTWPMRSAVVLRHVVGLSIGEISLAVDRPEPTVRSDLHRGLRILRTTLTKETP